MRSRRRQRMSRSHAVLEHSISSVTVVAANAAAVIVNLALCPSKAARMTGRTFRKRNQRSVCDIYNEFGKGYFRRAYRMKYSTFKRLASIHTSLLCWAEQELNATLEMDKLHRMSASHVPFVGLLVLATRTHLTEYGSLWMPSTDIQGSTLCTRTIMI